MALPWLLPACRLSGQARYRFVTTVGRPAGRASASKLLPQGIWQSLEKTLLAGIRGSLLLEGFATKYGHCVVASQRHSVEGALALIGSPAATPLVSRTRNCPSLRWQQRQSGL